MKPWHIAIIAGMAFMTGCASQPSGSVQAISMTPAQADSMATDAVGLLTPFYGPGRTTLNLKQTTGTFSTALDSALRQKGYAISADSGIRLRYIVDSYSNGQYLLRLSAPAVRITRLYGINPTGLMPLSSPSIDNIERGQHGQ